MSLPRGCRFVPNQFELIQYLSDKVAGRLDPNHGLIKEDVDVNGTSPDQLLVDCMASGGDGRLFCFTPIKFRKGTCRDRSTPDGYWKATNGRSSIKDEKGNPVGFTQTFSYYKREKAAERPKWIMKEYTLSAVDVPQNVALCVIYSTQNKFNKPNQADAGGCSGSVSTMGTTGNDFMYDPVWQELRDIVPEEELCLSCQS